MRTEYNDREAFSCTFVCSFLQVVVWSLRYHCFMITEAEYWDAFSYAVMHQVLHDH